VSIIEVVSLVKDIATLLALLIGGWLALFVFLRFAPKLNLRILPNWSDDARQFLILKFEVENKSNIRVYKQEIRIQVLEHKIQPGTSLSEWVPFDKDAIIPTERPVEWREPVEIFRTTKTIDPGEVISVERLYHYPQDTTLHVGLQVKAKLGFFGRIATRIRAWDQQWTTTCIVVK
jgi:hypothetical protein